LGSNKQIKKMVEGLITLGIEGEKVQHKMQLKMNKINNSQICILIIHLEMMRRQLQRL
jgi:hypothetical protein